MKAIRAGKFIMLVLTCILVGSLDPMRPYKNVVVECKSEDEARDVGRYAKRIGLQLREVDDGQMGVVESVETGGKELQGDVQALRAYVCPALERTVLGSPEEC